jgi:hypothetical protein
MKVSEIAGKDKDFVTKKEMEYVFSQEIVEAYSCSNGKEYYTFCKFEDGSWTKHDAATDLEIGSSEEEMEKLKLQGFKCEDVSSDYVFKK